MASVNRIVRVFFCVILLPGVFVLHSEESGAEDALYSVQDRRWTREDLLEELGRKSEWEESGIGISGEVMSPWTPMEVSGQAIRCWGRTYSYNNTLFPEQIESGGAEHLAGAPYIVLTAGGREREIRRGSVSIEKVNDSLVRVRTEAASGPFRLMLEKEYEFDGMAKVTLNLSGRGGAEIEGLELVFPIRAEKASLHHYIARRMPGVRWPLAGHPPMTRAGYTPEEGFMLDEFRPLIWLGDASTGFCWFAEGTEGWRILDETGIHVLEPEARGKMLLRIKFADSRSDLSEDLELVFGYQATPTRPRRDDFRWESDRSSFRMPWYWGEGAYYPYHTVPENIPAAREDVKRYKNRGMDMMPVSSLYYFGIYRLVENRFGVDEHGGLMNRELVLWWPLWNFERGLDVPEEILIEEDAIEEFLLKERHTPESDWDGRRFWPRDLTRLCANSSFQDYYIWKLKRLVDDVGIAAWYLDQPVTNCFNHHHGCGYINYRGEREPTVNIFAMREMVKRIRQVLYDAHGDARIRWHMSNQLLVPVLSLIETNWDGENYSQTTGTQYVDEFYSKMLDEGQMLTQHTGIQFGFSPDVIPQYERMIGMGRREHLPALASIWDMMGLFLVHDCSIQTGGGVFYPMMKHIQDTRMSYNPDDIDVAYYWEENDFIKVEPSSVRYILHHGDEKALLILFNWSDNVEEAEISVDLRKLFRTEEDIPLVDVLNKETIAKEGGGYKVSVIPRNMRMLEINSAR